VLIAAGLVVYAVGAAGGVTSLVAYSALLGVGVPCQANVCNLARGRRLLAGIRVGVLT
jgi:hypothetical protein